MSLANYDTAVEKIAALKAAELDPSIVNLATNNFITDDIIYIAMCGQYQIGSIIYQAGYTPDMDSYRIASGISIDIETSGYPMVYIKDSDITYSEPIVTYQNRLASCYTTALSEIEQSESFTAGINGSIILGGTMVLFNGVEAYTILDYTKFAIPASTAVTLGGTTSANCSYFDVPADW